MDSMLKNALLQHRALRNQLENMLLGEDSEEVEKQLKNFVAKRPCWVPVTKLAATKVTTSNTITVLPDLTIADRLTSGNYDWKNPNITKERFPDDLATVGEWEFDLYHPNCALSADAARLGAEVDGWVVAKWEHLLAYGVAFPETQRKFPIIALGSVCRVGLIHCVLGLFFGGRGRLVNLCNRGGGFDPYYRFLRVRKVQRSVA